MKRMLFLFLVIASLRTSAQSGPTRPAGGNEIAIRQLLKEQTAAWNRADLESFMKGYWENDSLMFVGKSGVTYGYKNTLANYKKGYPDTASMGKLEFTLIQLKKLSKDYYHVTGKWFLKRSIGDLTGYFTLLFRKIDDHWVIVADHSS
jgi:ketosteroid isomerase-like protein